MFHVAHLLGTKNSFYFLHVHSIVCTVTSADYIYCIPHLLSNFLCTVLSQVTFWERTYMMNWSFFCLCIDICWCAFLPLTSNLSRKETTLSLDSSERAISIRWLTQEERRRESLLLLVRDWCSSSVLEGAGWFACFGGSSRKGGEADTHWKSCFQYGFLPIPHILYKLDCFQNIQ